MAADFAEQIRKHLMKIRAELCKRVEEQRPCAVTVSFKAMST